MGQTRSGVRRGLQAAAIAAAAAAVAIAPAVAGAATTGSAAHDLHQRGAVNGATTTSPLLDHGGAVLATSHVYVVWWGSSSAWASDVQPGIGTFFGGLGGSGYANTATQYMRGGGLSIAASATRTDSSAPPRKVNAATLGNEVLKVFGTVDPAGVYFVYTSNFPNGGNFCAWHSAGNCGGTPIEFAWFFDLAGDPGCDPADNSTGHSQALAALANVSGHELSETVTDPQLNAWYDASGAENADKCAWTFGAPSLTFSNGSKWKVQGNWSNAAYNAGTGYPNSSGQKGCIGTT